MNCRDHDRLVAIQTQMTDLLTEAKKLLRREGGISWDRARSYWLAEIEVALSDRHDYVGGSMCTMQDTIAELREGD